MRIFFSFVLDIHTTTMVRPCSAIKKRATSKRVALRKATAEVKRSKTKIATLEKRRAAAIKAVSKARSRSAKSETKVSQAERDVDASKRKVAECIAADKIEAKRIAADLKACKGRKSACIKNIKGVKSRIRALRGKSAPRGFSSTRVERGSSRVGLAGASTRTIRSKHSDVNTRRAFDEGLRVAKAAIAAKKKPVSAGTRGSRGTTDTKRAFNEGLKAAQEALSK
jgi:hypothetical protein